MGVPLLEGGALSCDAHLTVSFLWRCLRPALARCLNPGALHRGAGDPAALTLLPSDLPSSASVVDDGATGDPAAAGGSMGSVSLDGGSNPMQASRREQIRATELMNACFRALVTSGEHKEVMSFLRDEMGLRLQPQ